MNEKPLPVSIVAASSIVPQVEFATGIEHLRRHGFEPIVHAQVTKHHFMFPGNDDERAGAFYEAANDPETRVVWMARGGYGATRILPLLDELTEMRGVPKKKLLVGYSDVTVLHEFVRRRWGWSTLHAPMPAASNFSDLDPLEWNAIVDYVKGKPASPPWTRTSLDWMSDRPNKSIRAQLIGGNLALWTAIAGTRYIQPARGKILFLEDLNEPFYRIDRMLVQLEQSGALDGAAAIVLGDFTECKDENNTCLARADSDQRKPLRKIFEMEEAFEWIFTPIARRLNLPLAKGLPVGHGPNFAPLPLGATYELSPEGRLKLLSWDWL